MRVVLGVALVGLVVCAGCGPPKPTREETIAAIKRLGGKVEVDENNDVVNVNLGGTKITGAGLVHLKGLTNLTSLNLYNTKVTDSGLVHLEGMTKLETLSIRATKITDAGLVHLKGLTKLQSLEIGVTKVTNAGVKKLKQALPNCKILH